MSDTVLVIKSLIKHIKPSRETAGRSPAGSEACVQMKQVSAEGHHLDSSRESGPSIWGVEGGEPSKCARAEES